ncbi:serine/threonine protein kinase BUD32 [Sporobolomyces koalae]|uniref:serine/threonine protein kinase BUD32 n=1 Tax=Sporobolomyces koalae TaxID=500713 RepID=UPI0031782FEF
MTNRDPSSILSNLLQLIRKVVEQKVYRTDLYPECPILIKHRFPKRYRHATLDRDLTLKRLQSEARNLAKCLRVGVTVPSLKLVDARAGMLGLEWIEGYSVRQVLGGGQEEDEIPPPNDQDQDDQTEQEEEPDFEQLLHEHQVSQEDMLLAIGTEIAKMHAAEIIHGDLTTSNMMIRFLSSSSRSFEIVLIDFGLSSASPMAEDKAVDLYVLERAFASTHPVHTDEGERDHFEVVLEGYEAQTRRGSKKGAEVWDKVWTRLELVRMRGRKRSMLG